MNYTYENTGYEKDNRELLLKPEYLMDGTGTMGYSYPISHLLNKPKFTAVGEICENAETAFGVKNVSDVVKVEFEKHDSKGRKHKVIFSCPTRLSN